MNRVKEQLLKQCTTQCSELLDNSVVTGATAERAVPCHARIGLSPHACAIVCAMSFIARLRPLGHAHYTVLHVPGHYRRTRDIVTTCNALSQPRSLTTQNPIAIEYSLPRRSATNSYHDRGILCRDRLLCCALAPSCAPRVLSCLLLSR